MGGKIVDVLNKRRHFKTVFGHPFSWEIGVFIFLNKEVKLRVVKKFIQENFKGGKSQLQILYYLLICLKISSLLQWAQVFRH